VTDTRSANNDGAATPPASRWLMPGSSDAPSPVIPPPVRSNRFKRPDDTSKDPSASLADRVERLEARLGAEIEATQRAVGGSLRALDKLIEGLEARVRSLERRMAADAVDRGSDS
jgi:hypothetical protein